MADVDRLIDRRHRVYLSQVKILAATFHDHARATRARKRLTEELALPNEPQMARAASPDFPGEELTLLAVRVRDEDVARARALIEHEGGELEAELLADELGENGEPPRT